MWLLQHYHNCVNDLVDTLVHKKSMGCGWNPEVQEQPIESRSQIHIRLQVAALVIISVWI